MGAGAGDGGPVGLGTARGGSELWMTMLRWLIVDRCCVSTCSGGVVVAWAGTDETDELESV
jgi:hypothetical protein